MVTVFPEEPLSAGANASKVCSVYPKLDYSKQSWSGVNLEIEERSLAEFYLAEGQRLAHMGSWAWNAADRSAVYLSEEWYRIYDFDPALGAPVWEKRLERVQPEDRVKWKSTIELAILEEADYDVDFRIVLPDGMVKWIHSVGHPVLSPAGELVKFLASSLDISRANNVEE